MTLSQPKGYPLGWSMYDYISAFRQIVIIEKYLDIKGPLQAHLRLMQK